MSKNPYLETLARMEPDIAMVDLTAAAASISISLKRIADASEAANKIWETHLAAVREVDAPLSNVPAQFSKVTSDNMCQTFKPNEIGQCVNCRGHFTNHPMTVENVDEVNRMRRKGNPVTVA